MHQRSNCILAAALLCLAAPAAAQQDERSVVFPRGTGMFSIEGRYVVGVEDGEDLPNVALAYDHLVLDNFSLGLEVAGYGYFKDGDDTAAIGLHGRLRHHVFEFGDDATMFLGVGFGPIYGGESMPAGGTHLNFVSRAGLGGAWKVRDDMVLTLGVDFWHLSNGQIVDGENPAINGVQGYVGIGWRL